MLKEQPIIIVYQRNLEVTPAMKDKRLFLYFEGVNSAADVFINYKTVGQHYGGYTTFCLEITDYVKSGNNDLEVWVWYSVDKLSQIDSKNLFPHTKPKSTEYNCFFSVFFVVAELHYGRYHIQDADTSV